MVAAQEFVGWTKMKQGKKDRVNERVKEWKSEWFNYLLSEWVNETLS
jgi:hypothetical protein